MESSFYRPEKLDGKEFDRIVAGVREELGQVASGKISDYAGAREYAEDLAGKGTVLEHDPEMMFWLLDEPQSMPADCRVEYVYKPTYCLTAALIALAEQYPELMEEDLFRTVLRKGMKASVGRSFRGAGMDALKGLFETLEIFAEAPIAAFLKKYPDFYPDFTMLWEHQNKYLKSGVETGKLKDTYARDDWSEKYDAPRAEALFEKEGPWEDHTGRWTKEDCADEWLRGRIFGLEALTEK